MIRIFALSGFAMLAFCAANPAFAQQNCGCTIRSEAEQLERNEVVIEGKIISLSKRSRLRKKYVVARVEISKAIKGTRRSYASVEALDLPGACAVPFSVDKTIKVAARLRGASYRTTICKIFPPSH